MIHCCRNEGAARLGLGLGSGLFVGCVIVAMLSLPILIVVATTSNSVRVLTVLTGGNAEGLSGRDISELNDSRSPAAVGGSNWRWCSSSAVPADGQPTTSDQPPESHPRRGSRTGGSPVTYGPRRRG